MVPFLRLPRDFALIRMTYYEFSQKTTRTLLQSRANVYVAHSPAGTSVQNILHWSQVSMKQCSLKTCTFC